MQRLVAGLGRRLWRLLAQLWSAALLLLRASGATRSTPVDPTLLAPLAPASRRLYAHSLILFQQWLTARADDPLFPHEIDDALLLYRADKKLPRAAFERLLMALIKVSPHLRGLLPRAAATMLGDKKLRPPRHTVPLPWLAALAMAYSLACRGRARTGALILLQWAFGLRPGEALSLVRESLTPPAGNLAAPDVAVIVLGVSRPTKVRRAQCATLARHENAIGVRIVERFFASTPPGARLTAPLSPAAYGGAFRRAAQEYGAAGWGWTPHSARAGWAAEQRLKGMPFSELKERGRWASDVALRTYLDISSAMYSNLHLGRMLPVAAWLLEDFDRRFPWW